MFIAVRDDKKAKDVKHESKRQPNSNKTCRNNSCIAIKIAVTMDLMDQAERRESARRALDTLISLGLTQKEIANRIDANVSTVSHIRNHPEWVVSARLVQALEYLVTSVQQESMHRLLPAVTVLEYVTGRHGPGIGLKRAEIEEAVRRALIDAVTHPKKSCKLPPGISAVVATLGESRGTEGAYIVMFDESQSAERKALLSHELRHILDRIEQSEKSEVSKESKQDKSLGKRAF